MNPGIRSHRVRWTLYGKRLGRSVEEALQKLSAFLSEAKRHIYSQQGEIRSTLPSARQYEFIRAAMSYTDIYFGESQFTGVETVRVEDIATWGMGYYGGIHSDIVDGTEIKDIFDFLGEALCAGNTRVPIRGTSQYARGGFRYDIDIIGDLSSFRAHESIARRDQIVWTYYGSGGVLRP
jgi:hypothetical protein